MTERPSTNEHVTDETPDDGDLPKDLPNEHFGPQSYEDALEDPRLRENYKRGQLYEVLVPSIYEGVSPGSEPILAKRIFAGWEDRDGERHPVFVTTLEWQEMRLKEEVDGLRAEGFQSPEPWMTLQEIADQVGASVRTIRRHIVERAECAYTEFGRVKKVRRSDFEEWLKKDLPVTKEIREVDSYRREDF